jgi:hypothetical protein
MLYDTLSKPPPPGSPLESLLILVWHMRQEAHFFEVRAIVQGLIDDKGEETEKAWKMFGDKLFPFQKAERHKSDLAALEYLKREIDKGPLVVKPMVPIVKSRLKSKRVHRHAKEAMSEMRVGEDSPRK